MKGCPGVDPAEVVVDFISSNYKRFSGGIFWINCAVPELMSSCIKYQEKVLHSGDCICVHNYYYVYGYIPCEVNCVVMGIEDIKGRWVCKEGDTQGISLSVPTCLVLWDG